MVVLLGKPYAVDKFTFGTIRDEADGETLIDGYRTSFRNGASAYQVFVPNADYFYTVALMNFGAIHEGSLPLDTAHRWEHAITVEQGYLKQLSRVRAAGGAYTEAHEIGITAKSNKQRAVVPSIALLGDTLVKADEHLDIDDNERDAISVECLDHYTNPKDSFILSFLLPSAFKDTPLERIAMPYYETPPTDIQFIRDFHVANYSPHRIVLVTAGPFDEDNSQTDEIFDTVAATLGIMETRPVVETRFDIPLEMRQRLFEESRPYPTAYVGLAFRMNRDDPKEMAALQVLDCILQDEDEGARRLIEMTRGKMGPGGFYHPHAGFYDLGYGAAYTIHAPTLPRKYKQCLDALMKVVTDKNIGDDLETGRGFAEDRVDDMLKDSESVADAVGESVHFPSIVNDPDRLRDEIKTVSLEDVVSVMEQRLNPEKAAIAVAAPIEQLRAA